MSSVYMIVFTVGLAVQILAAASCEEGAVRLNPAPDSPLTDKGHIQLCFNGQWTRVCAVNFHLAHASIVCRQLGYSDQAAEKSASNSLTKFGGNDTFLHFKSDSCVGTESTLGECTGITTMTGCNGYEAWVSCIPSNCINNDIRLVGGASYREGRVEVCVDGRWGTVCYNEELAGTVCQQLGFAYQGSAATHTNIPVKKVICANDNLEQGCEYITPQQPYMCKALYVCCAKSSGNCSAIEPTANGINIDPSANVCTAKDSSTRVPSTSETSATSVTTNSGDNTGQAGGTNNTTLGVLIGLLALLEIATVIGCVLFVLYVLKKKTTPPKPPRARGTSFINESYETDPPVQSEYSTVGPHYDVLKRNEPPKIEPYQPAHPPPVGGVSDDEFYNAEDHTYAAVPKKDKVKKQQGGAN